MVIRYRGLAGTLSYRSFHAAAKWTYKEGDRPLRRVRYKERPEGFSLASVLDQNAFHRRWTMTWRSRRPRAMKRRPRHQQPRCAAATAAVAISSPPARGRAFAHPLADCGRIADLPEIQEPRNQPQFPRALPHRPPRPPQLDRTEPTVHFEQMIYDLVRQHVAGATFSDDQPVPYP